MDDEAVGRNKGGLAAEARRPWYAAYGDRPWRVGFAESVAGLALLFFGVALGGGSREHVVPIGTLAAAIIGGGIALGQLQVARKRHEEQTKADLQRRITESFTKAVEQLGSEHLPVRVGGIYALERISRESDEDYWTVMETLTAFVRERARWKQPASTEATSAKERHEVPTDVAAVIAVVKRRKQQNREQEERQGWRLDLRLTNLREADFREAHLEGTDFRGAHLEGADLRGVHLEGANLVEAHLERADLGRAHLKGANLMEARLEGANLRGAHLEEVDLMEAYLKRAILAGAHLKRANLRGALLEEADLMEAYLEGADLSGAHFERVFLTGACLEGADLSDSIGLMKDQLEDTFGNGRTFLPEGVKRPDHWK